MTGIAPVTVSADTFRLIEHSVMYSEMTDGNKAIIEISDHGRGIAPDEIGHLWDRYYTKRQRGGKGVSRLELAIVKQIVNQHGGTCKAVSEPGKGSVFSTYSLDTYKVDLL